MKWVRVDGIGLSRWYLYVKGYSVYPSVHALRGNTSRKYYVRHRSDIYHFNTLLQAKRAVVRLYLKNRKPTP